MCMGKDMLTLEVAASLDVFMILVWFRGIVVVTLVAQGKCFLCTLLKITLAKKHLLTTNIPIKISVWGKIS